LIWASIKEEEGIGLTIHVGLVGYGLSGSVFHAPIIETIKDLKLSAIVTSNPEKVHRDFPHVKVVPTVDQLLEMKEISLVIITTPNMTHYEFAKKALLAHKHVVVEKPFVISSHEADELIALAKERNVRLSVYQNRRWDNDFLTIRQLLQTGMLGEISLYESHFDRFRPVVQNRWKESDLEGAGTLYDLGSHLIDQALVLFGLPQSVCAELKAQRPQAKTIDYFHIVLDYGHFQAILHSGSLVREHGPRFQLHGNKGSFIKYGFDSQEEALKKGHRPGDPGWGEDQEAYYGELMFDNQGITVKGKVKTLPGRYQAFYEDMVEAIKYGKPVPVSPEDARNTIKVIECAMRSHEERKVIPFD
jgi:scyllo-inositol 2-dehydrogenase (NADP+)